MKNPKSKPWTGRRRSSRCGPVCRRRPPTTINTSGTTTLFAALTVATGQIQGQWYPRHRNQEFLRLLKQVAKANPRVTLHIVVDNYATHKHPAVRAWLARNPRITFHLDQDRRRPPTPRHPETPK